VGFRRNGGSGRGSGRTEPRQTEEVAYDNALGGLTKKDYQRIDRALEGIIYMLDEGCTLDDVDRFVKEWSLKQKAAFQRELVMRARIVVQVFLGPSFQDGKRADNSMDGSGAWGIAGSSDCPATDIAQSLYSSDEERRST